MNYNSVSNLEKQLLFIRPAIKGYKYNFEKQTKKIKVSEIKTCILPVKCSLTGKKLFLKKAIKVSETDTFLGTRIQIRFYDPKTFMKLYLMI
jgi:hypothetical protein